MRPRIFACVALVAVLAPALARGAPLPSKAACIEAYKSSQELSRAGSLTQARSAALICAREPCPAVLRKDCADWVADVEQRLPTLLVVLRDESGRDMMGARVLVDGVEVASHLDGRTIEVDPGERIVEVIAEGRTPLKQSILARERDKGREVLFTFEAAAKVTTGPPAGPVLPPQPTEKPAPRPLPWTFWTGAAASAVGVAGFGVFGGSGLALRGELSSCKPGCTEERIDHGRTTFLVADVFLGVAVVGAGIATWIYLTHR